MNIAVFIAPALQVQLPLRQRENAPALKTEESPLVLGEADEAALAMALALSQKTGGVLSAYCIGPPEWEELLQIALAAGAQNVFRIWGTGWSPSRLEEVDGTGGTTKFLASVAHWAMGKMEKTASGGGEASPDLVLCGEKSGDVGQACFGAFLAHKGQWSFAHKVMELYAFEDDAPEDNVSKDDAPEDNVSEGDTSAGQWGVEVKLARGYSQKMKRPTPLVASISPREGLSLTEASLEAWVASRKKIPLLIPSFAFPSMGKDTGHTTLLRPALPRVKPQPLPLHSLDSEGRIKAMMAAPPGIAGTILKGTAEEGAQAAFVLIKEKGYLAGDSKEN